MKKLVFLLAILFVFAGCNGKSGTPSAYAPIRFEEKALDFIETDDGISEESFQDLSNSVRVLHNCGIVPFSRIESVEGIIEDTYIRDSSSFLVRQYEIQCTCDDTSFTVRFYKEKEIDTLKGSLLLLYRVTGNNCDYVRGSSKTERTSRECLSDLLETERQNSLTLLEERCGITEEEAIRLMEEFDLLYDEEVIHLHDIKSIEQAEQAKNTICLSLTSNLGKNYKVVISMENRPIILSITDSEGQVLYESEER